MSDKHFLNNILIEGSALTALGFCILILPKLTGLSFGVMLSVAFITYGIYKSANSFMSKNYRRNFLFDFILGLLLLTIGILLLLAPKVNLLWLIALIGVYFVLESISTSAFMSQIRTIYNFWGCQFLSSLFLLLAGLLIVLGLPVISFWATAMLCGLAILVKGVTKIMLFNANKDSKEY